MQNYVQLFTTREEIDPFRISTFAHVTCDFRESMLEKRYCLTIHNRLGQPVIYKGHAEDRTTEKHHLKI